MASLEAMLDAAGGRAPPPPPPPRAPPLLFNVAADPSEAHPLNARGNGSHVPDDDGVARLLRRFADAYAAEMATHTDWVAPPAPDAPGEGPGRYGVCCNRSAACYCV